MTSNPATLTVNPLAVSARERESGVSDRRRQFDRDGDAERAGAGGRDGGAADQQQYVGGDGAGNGDGAAGCDLGDVYGEHQRGGRGDFGDHFGHVSRDEQDRDADGESAAQRAIGDAESEYGDERGDFDGTVTLSGPAPAGGTVVQLASNNTSAATVPGTVTVAASSSTATFTVNTKAVAAATSVTITAT